jgi:hypothetical protein
VEDDFWLRDVHLADAEKHALDFCMDCGATGRARGLGADCFLVERRTVSFKTMTAPLATSRSKLTHLPAANPASPASD